MGVEISLSLIGQPVTSHLHSILNAYSFIAKMYGRYSRSLGEFAKEKAAEFRELEKKRKKEEKIRNKELRTYRGKWTSRFLRVVSFLWKHSFAKIGEDWVFLALLGMIMAIISFTMDYGSSMCNTGKNNISTSSVNRTAGSLTTVLISARLWIYRDVARTPVEQYFAWISLPIFLVLFSAGFVYLLAPQAIGKISLRVRLLG